jgi:hypothetical protein
VALLSTSAETKPRTLTLPTDVFRFPPLAGSGPVSDTASEIPAALARTATASPLNVVAACAKLATGLKTKIAVRQITIIEFFFAFICMFSPSPVKPQIAGSRALVGLNVAEVTRRMVTEALGNTTG